ncbi:hypothetical protein KCP73_01920 [Salmonella enterica subsp. enterica]|nr:hypothetical protein KCP73_01920 [Salmonella enterica subsp. enterica]
MESLLNRLYDALGPGCARRWFATSLIIIDDGIQVYFNVNPDHTLEMCRPFMPPLDFNYPGLVLLYVPPHQRRVTSARRRQYRFFSGALIACRVKL